MSTLSATDASAFILERAAARDAELDAAYARGHEVGTEETVAELIRMIRICKTNSGDKDRARHFIVLLRGQLNQCYDDLGNALAEAVGMVEDGEGK